MVSESLAHVCCYFVILKAYTEPTTSYLHGQSVYPGHQQGVVVQQAGTVTTIVTSQTVQQVVQTWFVKPHKRRDRLTLFPQ